MTNISFYKDLEVYYDGMYGIVDFICEKYITVCVRVMDHKSRNVCVLVYPSRFHLVKLAKESEK
jgi:hypothetical protein